MRFARSISWFTLVLAICLLTIPTALRADTLYNNIASTSNGQDGIGGFGPLADSFAVGASNFSFGSLTVVLSDTTRTGTVTAYLLSNSFGGPGAVLDNLGSILDSTIGTSLADYTFNLSTPFALLAGKTYWIELTDSRNGAAQWGWSLDQTAQGVKGQSYYNSLGVLPNTLGPYQMKISSAVTTPEPGMFLLLGLALGGLALLARKQ